MQTSSVVWMLTLAFLIIISVITQTHGSGTSGKKIQTHQEPPILEKDIFKSVWGQELEKGKAKEQEKVNKNMDKLNKGKHRKTKSS